MSKTPPPKKSKVSTLKTALSWIFDIGIVVLLIWYFSNQQNQASFWATIGSWFNKTVAISVNTVSRAWEKKPVPEKTKETENAQTEDSADEPPPPAFVPPPPPTEEELASEVPGDCIPPEARSTKEDPNLANLFYSPPPISKAKKVRTGHGKPIKFEKRKLQGVPFYQLTIDLNDPETYIAVRLPKNAKEANSTTYSAGHDNFETFVKRYPAAAMVNGTFFSKDEQERVMGNLVSDGKNLKYSPWENYGTTLALRESDYPEMITARAEGKPNWKDHYFSLTCGPRLLKEGEVWLNPELEGFADPHVLGCGPRSAIGFNKSRDRLILITFLQGLSLNQEAKLMKAIGCYEAMNLDGGASKALAHDNTVVMKPGRGLTNVLVVYDSKYKAPAEVIASWKNFQEGERPEIPSF